MPESPAPGNPILHLPVWVVVLVAFGGVVNPLLFLPLAFRASAQRNLLYRVASGVSFTSLSTGPVSTAIIVCRR